MYTKDSTGMELSVREGDRVRKGELLAQNKSSDTIQASVKKISDIEEQVSRYRSAYIEYDGIIAGSVEKSVSAYISEVGDLFSSEDLKLIESDLEQGVKSSDGIFENKVAELEAEKEVLNRGMQDSMVAVFPGVISYLVDGVEGLYDFARVKEFTLEDYDKLEQKIVEHQADQVGGGLKLVENNMVYVAIKLDKSYEKDLESRERLELEFLDQDLSVSARVESMVLGEEELLLILEVTEGIHRIQSQRYPRLALVKGRYDGLKIPSSAITENSGTRGVYIKDISGVVRFVPIRLLYRGRDHSIVNEEDTIEVEEDGEILERRALKVFDEVFKNSILVREGQIID